MAYILQDVLLAQSNEYGVVDLELVKLQVVMENSTSSNYEKSMSKSQ
jgi:hypothetical protein